MSTPISATEIRDLIGYEAPALGGKGTAALDSRLQEICRQVTDPTRRLLGKVTVAELVKGKGGKKR